jgi:PTS system mannose-specific IIA component
MPGLLIIAHAPLASSLKAVAEHAYPDCAPQLAALDVLPNVPVEEVEAQARQILERQAAQEMLIFTDVFGATPCNIAQRLADGVRIKVVAGVNVPMLWRTLCYVDESLDAVVSRAISGRDPGRHAGGDVAAAKPDAQARP